MADRLTDEALRELLENSTPGKRVQFHPNFCAEAEGASWSDVDTSHDTSVISSSGKLYRGYAHHKHAADALLDGYARDLATEVLELRARVAELEARNG